jgi:phosphopantothenoylcysteine synthetase/decarboxylase
LDTKLAQKAKARNLRNKKILITAGPTWVKIDDVRVISNIASGETGILLAQEAKNQGACVTLLLGPVSNCCLDKSIRILHFKFFDELKNKLIEELGSKKYDALIHSAAVSDYRPKKIFKHKVSSGLRQFNLKLVTTPKIVNLIKKIDNSVLSVAFKLEPHSQLDTLIGRAKKLFKSAGMDLVVANSILGGRYRAYILSQDRISDPIISKNVLAKRLIKEISKRF